MTRKKIAKKIAGVLPIGSLISYMEKQWNTPVEKKDVGIKMNLKTLGHTLYMVGVTAYIAVGIGSGLWTPQQYKQCCEKSRIERAQTEEYKQKLFGENGYAQKDDNLEISPEEKFEACKRAGLENKIIFPELYLEDLKKAIDSYEEGVY